MTDGAEGTSGGTAIIVIGIVGGLSLAAFVLLLGLKVEAPYVMALPAITVVCGLVEAVYYVRRIKHGE